MSEKAAYKICSSLTVTKLGLVGIFWGQHQQAAVATQLHQDCTKTTDCEFSFFLCPTQSHHNPVILSCFTILTNKPQLNQTKQ